MIPPAKDSRDLHAIVDDVIENKEKDDSVFVQCVSGRGRSGTFSAILASKMKSVKTVDELVNLIVGMRENRDGLVESPEQFQYIVNMLNLSMTPPPSISLPANTCSNGEGRCDMSGNVNTSSKAANEELESSDSQQSKTTGCAVEPPLEMNQSMQLVFGDLLIHRTLEDMAILALSLLCVALIITTVATRRY